MTAHEHCEDVLGAPRCDHYEGAELPDAYRGIVCGAVLIPWLVNLGLSR